MKQILSLSFLSLFITTTACPKNAHAGQPQGQVGASVGAEVAKERTCALVKSMRALDRDVAAAVKGRVLDGYFDFEALSQAPIAAHAAQLSNKDRAQLQQTFGKLIRLLAYQAGQTFRSGDVKVTPGEGQAEDTRRSVGVTVGSSDEDEDTRIDFVWADRKGTLKVVDVALDGASIVKDYENQFGRILRKEGAHALVSKMQARLVEAQRKRPT